MIVCVLSVGSYWRVPKDGRPVIWNSSGVADQRELRPRSKVRGHVRFNGRLYQEALGSSGLIGSLWLASPVDEHLGMQTVALERRASRASCADWYLVSLTEEIVGALDCSSCDATSSHLLSLSSWKTKQEALLLVRRHGWVRGTLGSAVLTPDGPHGDWTVNRW